MSNYTPSVCPHCSQTITYALPLTKGTAHIVLALFNAVQRLNRNCIHIDQEMMLVEPMNYDQMIKSGYMTASMRRNIGWARYHGLVAYTHKGSGEYLITPKGAHFLRNMPVPRTAIIDKTTKHNIGYFEDDGEVTFSELMVSDPYWYEYTREVFTRADQSTLL